MEVCNSSLKRSLKKEIDWQVKKLTHPEKTNAAESQWQLQPTHSFSCAKKASGDSVNCIHMSDYCIPLEKVKKNKIKNNP